MLDGLVEAVARATEGRDGLGGTTAFPTAVEGLTLLRSDHERSPSLVLYRPALCVALQGAKRTIFGDLQLDCGPGDALFIGIATPALGRVIAASSTEPYLGFVIELDMATLVEMVEEIPPGTAPDDSVRAGVFQFRFEGELADCARRMVRLLDTPSAIAALAPGIIREICYWLLTGPYGSQVRQVARLTGPSRGVAHSIHILRERFAEPVRVEELARLANMSTSAYHLRFKELTATSPLQYQKQLRLHEARRLLIANETNVEATAFRVGYESPSQFSRDYSRTFGLSPRRDIAKHRSGEAVTP